ncbi:hypothetical protein LCGC14_0915770 [marine sediment metagenome]|uniref:Uncharacterized protein n=1 Tax=marine sediment metagenome TaxID=412755 RepID=A0A0F9NSB8_9ZZZZ
MALGDRIKTWVEEISESWKDRLRGWMASWVEIGAEQLLDAFEPDLRAEIKTSMDRLKLIEDLPDDFKTILDNATEEPGFIQMAAILPYLVGMMIGLGMGAAAPISRIGSYQIDKLVKSFRLDPQTIAALWLRDKEKYQGLWSDLLDQGYSAIRLEGMQELVKIIPPLADMVRFADFGSFDPKIIELWREFYDAPSWITEPMSLLGITNEAGRDWANKYWFSHWRQPGRFELGEIYRRGLLGTPKIGQEEIGGDGSDGPAEELVKNAYLTQGFSSFWQDHLLQLVREIPTRVDIRRWWDMRTIDETELRSLYQRHGYFGKDLENYVVWTKVYTDFPMMMARFKNGWITEDDIRSWLRGLGMPEERITQFIQERTKPEKPARTATEKDLTKTEIYKGVKKDLISWEQGIELLMDLGYDEDEADYILAVNVGVLEGSPATFEEFKDWTTKYKIAAGQEVKPMPEELKKAAAELVRISDEVKSLEIAVRTEEQLLVDQDAIPPETEERLKELQVALNRARAEEERLQDAYNTQVAEFRQTEV